MVQEEEQHQKYSNSSSGGGGSIEGCRSSKKLKQKKVPQRGLGVAQLEKIRLEEQQKKDAAAGVSSPRFVLPLPSPPPPHHHHSSSSSPFPASPIDLSSKSSLFRTPPPGSISNLDLLVPPPPPPPYGSHFASGGGGLVDTVTTFTGQGHYSSIWNNELNYNGDVPRLDHGLAVRSQLQNEASYPIWHSPYSPSPVVIDRKQPHSSTMGNVPSFTSSSSGLSFPMELPSNQSFCSINNNYTPPLPWPEEEKMVGIKRPWPFSLDNMSIPPKLPSIIQPIYRLEEPPSLCGSSNGNGSQFKLESGDCIISEDTSSELKIKETGSLDGDFLTLGTTTSSKKQHLVSPQLDFHSLVSIQESLLQPASSLIEQQQHIHNFFPSKGQISGVTTTTTNNYRRVEEGDTVDLNLKL